MLEIWILCIYLQYESPKINPVSYAFFTVSARPGSDLDKQRKKPYVLLAYPSTGERETEKLRLPENQNSFLPSAAYHPTTERDLQRTCAKVSLSDLLLQKQLVQEDLLQSKRRRTMIGQHGGTLEQDLLSHALEHCPKPSEKKKTSFFLCTAMSTRKRKRNNK
jgi:hypothetical protein